MYLDEKKGGRVGRVAIDIKRASYRLRFTYPEKTNHAFIIAQATPEGWVTAVKAAQLINRDIDLGDFDDTYARYSPKHASKLAIAQKEANKEYSLKELWEAYKEAKKGVIAETTQERVWKPTDKLLSRLGKEHLSLQSADLFLNAALQVYAAGTLKRLFEALYAAATLAAEQGKIAKNPYRGVKKDLHTLCKNNESKKPQCFEDGEVQLIIEAFRNDAFASKKTKNKDSYYASYVEFLALTGCRPEEACALTWHDIRRTKDKIQISFSKAYSHGVLLPHTKTKEIRLFPCNEQMIEFLGRCPKIENKNNLMFPGRKGGYLDHHNFRNRQWARVVLGLCKQGKIYQYLKPYCLRHTFITRLIRSGADPATVGGLVGNSAETIVLSYLAKDRKFEIPRM